MINNSTIKFTIPLDISRANRLYRKSVLFPCRARYDQMPIQIFVSSSNWDRLSLNSSHHENGFFNLMEHLHELLPKENNKNNKGLLIFKNGIEKIGIEEFEDQCMQVNSNDPEYSLFIGFHKLALKLMQQLMLVTSASIESIRPKLDCTYVTNFENDLVAQNESLQNMDTKELQLVNRHFDFKIYKPNYFIKIDWNKQNKHIKGRNNFDSERDRGEITIDQVKLEALVKKFAGTGKSVSEHIETGKPGYKERLDFNEVIGIYAKKNNQGELVGKFETTKGILAYADHGFVHLFPSDPNAIIEL